MKHFYLFLTFLPLECLIWGASLSKNAHDDFKSQQLSGENDLPHEKESSSETVKKTDKPNQTKILYSEINSLLEKEKIKLNELEGEARNIRHKDLITIQRMFKDSTDVENFPSLFSTKSERSLITDPSTMVNDSNFEEDFSNVQSEKNVIQQQFEDLQEDPKEQNVKSSRIIDIFLRSDDRSTCTTPKGEKGHCRSISQCLLSEPLNNYSLFLPYLCILRSIFVGVCCPDNPVIEISEADEDINSTQSVVTEFKQPPLGCGHNVNTRIVGGSITAPFQWSWMVALTRRNRFFCGGVIINNWYVLTAAHCVLGVRIKDLKVRLGEYDFAEKHEHQHDIPVAEIKRHALFVTLTFQHDIALLKLKRQIEYNKFVGSICLPSTDSGNFTGVDATVVGWGAVSFGGAASPILRQVTIPVWDNHECDETYLLESITDSFLCAGAPKNGEDACQGDSGGPLMSLNGDHWEVIGLVSWGRRCGDPKYPGVYTRITTYLDWIAENTT